MKLAVISDIHGNSAALRAVLDDIARRGVDLTVNLGDCFSGPLDVVGTADMLDVTLPDDAAEDSTSILPLLTGEATTLTDRPAVVHHDYRGNFAIRQGKWKLITYDKPELYDMEADPKETTNLIEQQPEVAAQLAALLQMYKDSGRSRD